MMYIISIKLGTPRLFLPNMCFRCNQCGLAMCCADHDPWPKVGHITSQAEYRQSIREILEWTEQQERGDELYYYYYIDKKSNEAQWVAKLCPTCLLRRNRL